MARPGNLHPDYRPVVFRDTSSGTLLLTRSTCPATATVEYEGATDPVVDVDISAASHPFWTGKQRVMDSEGRVEKFLRRYGTRPSGAPAGGEK